MNRVESTSAAHLVKATETETEKPHILHGE